MLFIFIAVNIAIVHKLKVYENFNSMSIMVCLTIILLDRLVTYLIRVIVNEYDDEEWVWYRISTDIVGYLIGIIAIVLLM